MNKIVLGLALVASTLFADIKWAKSYEQALSRAAKEKKNVMVMLAQEGCPPCEYMKEIVFEESAIQDVINEKFVSVHFDVKKDKLPAGLRYIGTPTFHFLNAKGVKLKTHVGGANIPEFLAILNSVKK